MHQPPKPLQQTEVHDIRAIASELIAGDAYTRSGHAARTVARTRDLRVVVVALGAGQRINEHQAAATASIQVVSGEIAVEADRRLELPAGSLLLLEAGAPHDVEALSDAVFVLTLGWSPKKNGAT